MKIMTILTSHFTRCTTFHCFASFCTAHTDTHDQNQNHLIALRSFWRSLPMIYWLSWGQVGVKSDQDGKKGKYYLQKVTIETTKISWNNFSIRITFFYIFYINSGHFSTKQENISVRPILSSELRLVKGRILYPGTIHQYYRKIKSEKWPVKIGQSKMTGQF